ncbi:MAG: CRISPR-associated endoribonuclease Cas6 [Cyclobacteriaceae bacterium]
MRIICQLSAPQHPLPFDHIPYLTGTIHKWIGNNKVHGEISLYSFSWLQGGKSVKQGLSFPDGGQWSISSHDTDLIKSIIQGIQEDSEICFGMRVHDITIVKTPDFGTEARFLLASPVLIKRRDGERIEHVLFDHPNAGDYLTEKMVTKLKKANLNAEGISIDFDKMYRAPKTKLVNYRGIKNKASMCPILVKGSPEQIAFVWNVGVGNSTGIGFGALK